VSPDGTEVNRGRRHEGETVPDSAALLRFMAAYRNTYGLAQVAADVAPRIELCDNYDNTLTLVVGDAFADRVAFWNLRSRASVFPGREPCTLIIPPSRLDDPNFLTALSEFLNNRAGGLRKSGASLLQFCSTSLTTEQLTVTQERFMPQSSGTPAALPRQRRSIASRHPRAFLNMRACPNRFNEDFVLGDGIEERHRRPEFEVVRRAQNRIDRLFARCHHQTGAPNEAWPQDIMRDVSLGFPFRADCEALRHHTEAEAGDLGKNEPHPMAPFPAVG